MIPFLLAQRSFWLEMPASVSALEHDRVFYALLYVMTFFFCLVVAIMLAFVVLYRRRKGQQQSDDGPTHNMPLEIFWTLVPLVVVAGFFVIGLRGFVDLESPPPGADVVDVEASQWHFNFKYPNGADSDELYVQVDRPVLLRLTSKPGDVTHALYIPVFRIQRNAIPGRITQLWFQPTELTGPNVENAFHVFCTQYCGLGHAEMHAWCYVLNKEDYAKKLADAANIFYKDKKPVPYVDVGKKLYTSNCAQCHTVGGGTGQGPTWKGLYKSSVRFGSSNVPGYTLSESDDDEKWDDYLVESILHPEAKIVQGFGNIMPSQESAFSDSTGSQRKLSTIVADIEAGRPTTYKEKKLAAITEYIKSVGDPKYYKPMKAPPIAPAGASAGASTGASTGTDSAKPPAAASSQPEASAMPPKSAGEPADTSATPPSPRKEDMK